MFFSVTPYDKSYPYDQYSPTRTTGRDYRCLLFLVFLFFVLIVLVICWERKTIKEGCFTLQLLTSYVCFIFHQFPLVSDCKAEGFSLLDNESLRVEWSTCIWSVRLFISLLPSAQRAKRRIKYATTEWSVTRAGCLMDSKDQRFINKTYPFFHEYVVAT